jgi:predicted porin
MDYLKALFLSSALCMFAHPLLALEADFYASLRIAAESVSPDGDADDDYIGLRDSGSRVGAIVSDTLVDDWKVTLQGELPVDTVNFGVHASSNEKSEKRITKIELSSPLGTVWYGRNWMPYYNSIVAPVDIFSSYYSGWSTPTAFRRAQTLAYISPNFNGFQLAAATSNDNGNESENRNQLTASYAVDGFKLAAGVDDNPGDRDDKILGVSTSYTTGRWYMAAKYEEMDTDDANDGGSAKNILLQYKIDSKNTVRATLADVDLPAWGGFGGLVFHVGWDYQFSRDLRFFIEYYQEESTASISKSHDDFSASGALRGVGNGGQLLTVGLRYDLSLG